MLKFSLKKKFLVILPIISLLFGVPVVTYLYANNAPEADIHAEHDHLIRVVEATRLCINRTQRLAERFFSTTDNNSIQWFVANLDAELIAIDTELLKPLQQKTHSTGRHSPEYVEIIKRSVELLKDLRDNAKVFLNTLRSNLKPSNALNLVKPLQQVQTDVTPRVERIMKKFEELHNLVKLYDSTIARDIAVFMKEFDESINNQPGKAQLLKGLMHRVKCCK